jgi:hypothetical protein
MAGAMHNIQFRVLMRKILFLQIVAVVAIGLMSK